MSNWAKSLRRGYTLWLVSLGVVGLGLPDGMLGVAWPSIRASFGLPLDALGLLLATFAAGYFLSSAASGQVITRLGIGKTLAVSCGASSVALVGYAASSSWPVIVALGLVLGFGGGTIDGGLNTYAAIAYGSKQLNWLHAGFGVGAAIGPLVMTAILTHGLSWNTGFLIVAAAQFALATAYWFTRQNYPSANRTQHQHQSASAPTKQLLRQTLAWISLALFFVYVGLEATVGQWSFSLFTLSRDTPTAVAGVLLSSYWAAITVGRILFGFVVSHLSPELLLRTCMLVTIGAALVIWLNLPVANWVALSVLGLAIAPIFPVLIAETPSRLGQSHTANAVGFQVAAAVLGGATIPGSIGVLAAHLSLEVVGPCLVALGAVQLLLHELLIRPAYARRRSARSRSSEAATVPPRA